MSTGQTPKIVWIQAPAFPGTQYGMVGAIKAFSLRQGSQYSLDPRLPNRKGVQHLSEEFSSREKAYERAELLLAEFLQDLSTAATTQQAS